MVEKYRFILTHSLVGASIVDTLLNREYAIGQQLEKKMTDRELTTLIGFSDNKL